MFMTHFLKIFNGKTVLLFNNTKLNVFLSDTGHNVGHNNSFTIEGITVMWKATITKHFSV